MSRADADLYYQNCAEYVTGQVALWCKAKGRRFVYSVASDPDCDPSLPKMETLRERVLYRYGLLRADRVIVQTRKQQKMMKDGFGVDARILPMACPAPPEARMKAANAEGSRNFRILWVGRISRIKRPEMILDIARMIPDVSFEIVGAPDQEDEYSRCLHQAARKLPNVTFHGRLPRDRMPDMFQSASLLCCTSAWEGFPNTFLEAWSYGLPVVSTVDPDDLIGTEGLGAVVGDPASARSAIEKLRRDVEFRKSISENAWRYYLGNHTLETVMPKYERTFIEVVRKGKRA
jgi:glycosyltransferase involved in cell wall biosynthesis